MNFSISRDFRHFLHLLVLFIFFWTYGTRKITVLPCSVYLILWLGETPIEGIDLRIEPGRSGSERRRPSPAPALGRRRPGRPARATLSLPGASRSPSQTLSSRRPPPELGGSAAGRRPRSELPAAGRRARSEPPAAGRIPRSEPPGDAHLRRPTTPVLPGQRWCSDSPTEAHARPSSSRPSSSLPGRR